MKFLLVRLAVFLSVTLSVVSLSMELTTDTLALTGMSVRHSVEENLHVISIDVDTKKFVDCTSRDYYHFIIWDKDSQVVYRERINVATQSEKAFYVDPELVSVYTYQVFIDRAKTKSIDVGPIDCRSIRSTLNRLDLF